MAQHPSQALLDLRTMLVRLGLDAATVHEKTLAGVTVTITGDILHSRVARSNAIVAAATGGEGDSVGGLETAAAGMLEGFG